MRHPMLGDLGRKVFLDVACHIQLTSDGAPTMESEPLSCKGLSSDDHQYRESIPRAGNGSGLNDHHSLFQFQVVRAPELPQSAEKALETKDDSLSQNRS